MEEKLKQIEMIAAKNPQILICGNGYNVATAMKKISEQLHKAEENYILQKLKEELRIFDSESAISALVGTNSTEFLIDEITFALPKEDIPSLKKRIKHCKNYMEKQRLQKELNALYKEQKVRK